MADYDQRPGIEIGEVLKATRTRQGLDIATVEERTKIRTKYLRALENEEWEVLPSPAYAKGFLRTYAQLLGLDGDALADEFRRQVEVSRRQTYPVSEPVLKHRRRFNEPPRGPRLGALLAVGAAAAVVVLLILGLIGGGDGDGGDPERGERRSDRQERRQEQQRKRRRRERRREARQGGAQGPVRLRMVMNADVPVCLVGDGERPLIAGQVVSAGTEESFAARRFVLQFPSGYDSDQLRLFLNGERERLPEGTGPTAYRITGPGRVRRAPDPGRGCP